MTPDELGSILADLRGIVDRVALAHDGLDADQNPTAAAGIVIAQHGLSLASDGLACFARATGCDGATVSLLTEAHVEACRLKGIVVNERALAGARGWIRLQADEMAGLICIGREGKTEQ
jgi:hypothetical protein